MASGFTYAIDADAALEKLADKKINVEKVVEKELSAFGLGTVNDAKRLAPVDEGYLRNSIGYTQGNLKVTITVNADYAAYVEFGTKGFAASYVATLPQDWQTFAAQFKGKGSGDMWEFLKRLTEWVKRKGVADQAIKYQKVKATGSVRTVRNRKQQKVEDDAAAYNIAFSILRKGIKAHPFLYPAFEKNRLELIKNLKAQIEK